MFCMFGRSVFFPLHQFYLLCFTIMSCTSVLCAVLQYYVLYINICAVLQYYVVYINIICCT